MELICTDGDGFRSVNKRETDALKFTFGVEVGNWLIGIIKVQYEPILAESGGLGQVGNQTEIEMRSDYNPSHLGWLAVFIHEAAHIWQRNTGCNRGGQFDNPRDYRYYYTDFPKLTLKVEEHASAIGDWFYVKYGLERGVFRTQDLKNLAWRRILKGFGFEWHDWSEVKHGLDALEELAEVWEPVIKDIRDPKHMTDSICTREEAPHPAG